MACDFYTDLKTTFSHSLAHGKYIKRVQSYFVTYTGSIEVIELYQLVGKIDMNVRERGMEISESFLDRVYRNQNKIYD